MGMYQVRKCVFNRAHEYVVIRDGKEITVKIPAGQTFTAKELDTSFGMKWGNDIPGLSEYWFAKDELPLWYLQGIVTDANKKSASTGQLPKRSIRKFLATKKFSLSTDMDSRHDDRLMTIDPPRIVIKTGTEFSLKETGMTMGYWTKVPAWRIFKPAKIARWKISEPYLAWLVFNGFIAEKLVE